MEICKLIHSAFVLLNICMEQNDNIDESLKILLKSSKNS